MRTVLGVPAKGEGSPTERAQCWHVAATHYGQQRNGAKMAPGVPPVVRPVVVGREGGQGAGPTLQLLFSILSAPRPLSRKEQVSKEAVKQNTDRTLTVPSTLVHLRVHPVINLQVAL